MQHKLIKKPVMIQNLAWHMKKWLSGSSREVVGVGPLLLS